MKETEIKGFLLDTTAIIDFLRGSEYVTALLETLRSKAPLASCPVTVAETFAGPRKKNTKRYTPSFHPWSFIRLLMNPHAWPAGGAILTLAKELP